MLCFHVEKYVTHEERLNLLLKMHFHLILQHSQRPRKKGDWEWTRRKCSNSLRLRFSLRKTGSQKKILQYHWGFRSIPFGSEYSLPLFFHHLTRLLSLPFLSPRSSKKWLTKWETHYCSGYLRKQATFVSTALSFVAMDSLSIKQGYALKNWVEELSDEAVYPWESPKKKST